MICSFLKRLFGGPSTDDQIGLEEYIEKNEPLSYDEIVSGVNAGSKVWRGAEQKRGAGDLYIPDRPGCQLFLDPFTALNGGHFSAGVWIPSVCSFRHWPR